MDFDLFQPEQPKNNGGIKSCDIFQHETFMQLSFSVFVFYTSPVKLAGD